jgi:hypothetical protein
VGLTISGLDAIRTGFFTNYTATATLSNGTTQSVTPSWTSSSQAVATVDGTGRLTGMSHGSTNLTASHQGVNASKTVQVVNNYGGSWAGTYVIRKCDQSGAFRTGQWCQNLGGVGAILPASLALSQSGGGQNQIGGTLALGSLAGNISGNVSGDGRLNISGSFNVSASGVTLTITIGGWDTTLAGPGVMVGRWAQSMAAVGATGNAYMENEIVQMVQTSTSARSGVAPAHYLLEWAELFSRMR